eukprot:gene25893-biopygen7528
MGLGPHPVGRARRARKPRRGRRYPVGRVRRGLRNAERTPGPPYMSGVGPPASRQEAPPTFRPLYVWGWGPSSTSPHHGRRLTCSSDSTRAGTYTTGYTIGGRVPKGQTMAGTANHTPGGDAPLSVRAPRPELYGPAPAREPPRANYAAPHQPVSLPRGELYGPGHYTAPKTVGRARRGVGKAQRPPWPPSICPGLGPRLYGPAHPPGGDDPLRPRYMSGVGAPAVRPRTMAVRLTCRTGPSPKPTPRQVHRIYMYYMLAPK